MANTNKGMVSVIIVNWNGEKWLPKCLDSLLQQTYKNIEIIVVDNNSHDASISLVSQIYPHVKLVQNQSNLGFAAGNNAGTSQARGELILLLNNDTWLKPDAVELLIKERAARKLDVIAPREADYYTERSREPYTTLIDMLGHPAYIPSASRANFYLTGVCLLFRKELYETSGGLDNNFFMYVEEVDWFWRLLLLKKSFAYSEIVEVYHAGGSSSKQSGLNEKVFLWRNQNTLQMLLKNYRLNTLALLLPLYLLQNIIEIIAFLLLLKPTIALTYIKGWVYTLQNIKSFINRRADVQQYRLVNDMAVMAKMYKGPAKLIHIAKVAKHGN